MYVYKFECENIVPNNFNVLYLESPYIYTTTYIF